jgi:hypothetical protein
VAFGFDFADDIRESFANSFLLELCIWFLAWLSKQLLVRPADRVDWTRGVWVELRQWFMGLALQMASGLFQRTVSGLAC